MAGSSLLGSFLGVWSNGENLKGFNVFYRQLARYVIPPEYNGVLAAIKFISSSRIKPTLPTYPVSLPFSPAPAR